MESPWGNAGSSTPAGDQRASSDPSLGGGLRSADAPAGRPWLYQDGHLDVLSERVVAGESEEATIGAGSAADCLPAGYWRHLQRLACSDDAVINAAEVLELLLHFGRTGRHARSLATQLLDRFGSLGAVMTADPAKLSEVLRSDVLSVTLLKAVRVAVKAVVREPLEDRPVISSASALMDYLSVTMRYDSTEATRILFLDRKNALIKDEILHRGTVDHTPLYPREVVRRVIELGACAVILVHNHPSGDPTPSQGDVEMTRGLSAALSTINVVLHDHVIVGRNRETSLRKLGLI